MRAAALSVAIASSALAQHPPPSLAPPPPTPAVAVTPLRDSGLPAADIDRAEKILIAGLEEIGLHAANARLGKLTSPKRSSAEARFAEDPAARALALGGELKAPLALAIDAAALGDGVVLYMQGVDVAKGKPIASTAFSFGQGALDHEQLDGALLRVLAPERYLGKLVVEVDVGDAQVLVDGAARKAGELLPLACGTHTLRVTHPAYRDFLRFVTVDYGKPTRVEVALSKYPVTEAEMRARLTGRRGPVLAPTPWWQRWWVVTLASVVLLGAATGITAAVAHEGIAFDRKTPCCQ